MLESFWQDVRYGVRVLGNNPAFTALAVLTLALGIGANSAIFSILDPPLLRKLPVRNPEELLWVNSSGPFGRPAEGSEVNTYHAYRAKASAFASILAFSGIAPYDMTYEGRKISAKGELVSANYFTALGVRPFAGRLLADSDEHGPPALAVSFAFWNRELGSSKDVIGKMSTFGDQLDATRTGSVPQHAFRVVGVAPPAFFGAKVGESPDFYVPLNATELPTEDYWQSQWVTILARLKPAISLAQASADLDPLWREALTDFFCLPGTHGDLEIRASASAKNLAGPLQRIIHSFGSSVTITGTRTLREQVDESLHSDRLIAALCAAVSVLALLLTCVGLYGALAFNVAHRTSEIGIRVALGARPQHIFQLVVGQGMRLTVAGLMLGIAAALCAGSLLKKLLFGIAPTDPLMFLAAPAVLPSAAFLACYLPARRAMRLDTMSAFRDE